MKNIFFNRRLSIAKPLPEDRRDGALNFSPDDATGCEVVTKCLTDNINQHYAPCEKAEQSNPLSQNATQKKVNNSFKLVLSKFLNNKMCLKASPALSKAAFTLAEVLITLGIIGIVAAITIPTLMVNTKDAQFKTAYKKSFSVAQQALNSANKDYLMATPAYDANFKAFMAQFIVMKDCTTGDNRACWELKGERYGENLVAGGYPSSDAYAFIDSSGVAWAMPYSTADYFFVDTNGAKKPNQWGKDRLSFYWGDQSGNTTGLPIKIKPFQDNYTNACFGNKCGVELNYYGTSWLYN